MTLLRLLAILLGCALIGCGEDSPNTSLPSEPFPSPAPNVFSFPEAEELLGFQLVIPEYVPDGLAPPSQASVASHEAEKVATLFYFPGASYRPGESLVETMTITLREHAGEILEGDKSVLVSGTKVALVAGTFSPDLDGLTAVWQEGELGPRYVSAEQAESELHDDTETAEQNALLLEDRFEAAMQEGAILNGIIHDLQVSAKGRLVIAKAHTDVGNLWLGINNPDWLLLLHE